MGPRCWWRESKARVACGGKGQVKATLIVGSFTHLFIKCLLGTCSAPLVLGQVLGMVGGLSLWGRQRSKQVKVTDGDRGLVQRGPEQLLIQAPVQFRKASGGGGKAFQKE